MNLFLFYDEIISFQAMYQMSQKSWLLIRETFQEFDINDE